MTTRAQRLFASGSPDISKSVGHGESNGTAVRPCLLVDRLLSFRPPARASSAASAHLPLHAKEVPPIDLGRLYSACTPRRSPQCSLLWPLSRLFILPGCVSLPRSLSCRRSPPPTLK
mmetsp:Transcript_78351/g.91556  ORF Transcript_78351/g.91556 Transcript_78351/m.91556 type:complete len:117 (-) Transcript_78351:143-493(-)